MPCFVIYEVDAGREVPFGWVEDASDEREALRRFRLSDAHHVGRVLVARESHRVPAADRLAAVYRGRVEQAAAGRRRARR